MYKNIGRTLKNKGIWIIIRMTATYAIAGGGVANAIFCLLELGEYAVTAMLIGAAVFGTLGFGAGRDKAAMIYAFGELVENTTMLRWKFCGDIPPVPYPYVQPAPQPPKPVAWVCPHCNTPNTNNGHFCIGCGRQR